MGQNVSKKSAKKSNASSRKMMVKKIDGKKITVSEGNGGSSFLTYAKADGEDDDITDAEDELYVPRTSRNVCGIFLKSLVITSPIDDPMGRDLAIFELFNYDGNEERMFAYIARPEVSKKNALLSFEAMAAVLSKTFEIPAAENMHFPRCVVSGRLKRLIFGAELLQQAEHDPEWHGRRALIVTLPSNGVFISALLALSPTGTIPKWLSLVVGLGLARCLNSLHKLGFIHRYVTPWNFFLLTPFSIDKMMNQVLHMDLSLATKWSRKKTHQMKQFTGTIKYSSIRAMARHNQGPADDFISVIFIVAEMISGTLPWLAYKDRTECCEMKKAFCHSVQFQRLPREIRQLYETLCKTYGLNPIEFNVISTAFEQALERMDWRSDTSELPDWLCMPLEELDE